MSALFRHLLLCCAVACGMLPAAHASAAGALPEYMVKAGYLYNFALLTEWPSVAAGEPLELCVIGDDGLGVALQALQGKTANNRQINVRVLAEAAEAYRCHILFIADVERSDFAQLKREIAGRPVLTVTDNEQFAKSGMAIFLRAEGSRLVFEIAANVVRRANLNISARLLRLAHAGAGE
jgi:hypothetical protein